jgi:hypothetical protein
MRSAAVSAAFFIFLLCAGCSKPSIREAVYDGIGPTYSLMKPLVKVPTAADPQYKTNTYRYLPGFITSPALAAERDDYAHKAAVWRIGRGAPDCPPSANLYHLNDMIQVPRLPVSVEYVLDTRRSFLATNQSDVSQAKYDLSLSNNDLRFVSRIAISFTKLTDYSTTAKNLSDARDTMRRSCRENPSRYRKLVQVDSIVSGDVFVEIDKMEGSSVDLGRLKAKIYRAISKRTVGHSVFFAVSSRPVVSEK